MKYLKTLVAILILFLFFSGVSYAWQKVERDVDTFTGISLRISATVYLKQGNTQSIVIEGPEDEIEDIETNVKGNVLVIEHEARRRWFSWRSSGRVDIYVTVKDIESISVSGSGKVISERELVSRDLDLDVSGSGRIDIEVEANDVYVDISGSGKIDLEGTSNRNEVRISGSGKLSAENLKARAYEIRISGSGSARIDAEEAIYARISGSGDVYYRGNPDKIRSDISGSGSVRKL